MLDPDVLSWWGASGPLEEFSRTVYEMRRIIEPEAAAMAAMRGSDHSIARISRAYEAMAASVRNVVTTIEPDVDFHMSIVDAAGNDLLRSLGTMIETALIANFRVTSSLPHALHNSLPLHLAVLERICARDPVGARAAMVTLIDDSISLIRRACAEGRG
jgi:DNA-binding FadR family transcriptional regulator